MKSAVALFAGIILLAFAPAPAGAGDLKLEPNAQFHLEFPNLPPTLHSRITGDQRPACMSVQLPENYSSAGSYPVFVYLGGGDGGPGNAVASARRIIGPRDFVSVNLPLFREVSVPAPEGLRGLVSDPRLLVHSGDFSLLQRCYREMLTSLSRKVPNIDPTRSAFGGFSNGAHAASMLVAGKDDGILGQFRAFYFIEGGSGFLSNPLVLRDPDFQQRRLLFLVGDHANNPPMQARFARLRAPVLATIASLPQEAHSSIAVITMRGYGHEQPPEYLDLLARWARGEPHPKR